MRRAFAEHDPTGATSNDSRTRLAAAVDTLHHAGTIVLPKSRRLYETHVAPALPQWVARPSAPRARREPPPVRVWRPELADAAAMAITQAEHDVLAAVDEFLRNDGTSRPLVPHRERSVELFGNEKRLDALARTKLFTTEALTLELLRCYRAPLPLTAQHTGSPGTEPHLLIVENHATYASVLRLARERAAVGQLALAVGFGSGNQLPKAIEGVVQLDPQPLHLWYFGDLDGDGLAIASSAAVAARLAGLPPLRPAIPLYRALLSTGARQPGKRAYDVDAARRLTGWLSDPAVRAAADEVLTAGNRVAQESVGLEALDRLDTWT
ncbi:MAG: hypothetical protein ACRCZD_06805 [Phycicoccus sp.]